MGRLVYRAKLELVLAEMVLRRVNPDGGNLISIRRLDGSIDIYWIVSV